LENAGLFKVPFAPGESRMRFSPWGSSTRITATPVLPATVVMEEVSMKDFWRLEVRTCGDVSGYENKLLMGMY